MTDSERERKELQAQWRKLAKVIGQRSAPPKEELQRRWREVMAATRASEAS